MWRFSHSLIFYIVIPVCHVKGLVQCFEALNTSPELPEEGVFAYKVVTCSTDDSFCYRGKNMVWNRTGSTTEMLYSWGCTSPEKWNMEDDLLKCGDAMERSTGELITIGHPHALLGYVVECTCCGDLCNNVTEYDSCHLPPVFVKECYSYLDAKREMGDPRLPMEKAAKVLVTEKQYCSKIATVNDDGVLNYEWGAISFPRGQCGDGSFLNNTSGEGYKSKLCTCCGRDCNGPQMDSITLSSSLCQSEPAYPSTAATTKESIASTETEKQSTTADNPSTGVPLNPSTIPEKTAALPTTTTKQRDLTTSFRPPTTSTKEMITSTEKFHQETTKEPTTTKHSDEKTTQPVTTEVPPLQTDTTVIIVGSVLGSLLAISLTINGYIMYRWYKMQQANDYFSMENPYRLQVMQGE